MFLPKCLTSKQNFSCALQKIDCFQDCNFASANKIFSFLYVFYARSKVYAFEFVFGK